MTADTRQLLEERAAFFKIPLPAPLADRLVAYYALLMRWNRKINLTSLADSPAAVDRLVLEPLAAAAFLPRGAALADLGSGGGSPAIPLALALGSPQLLMVESRSRKAAFLREAAREVGQSCTVEAMRFEELAASGRHTAFADVVSARAVRPDRETMELAWKLANSGGLLAFFVSAGQDVALEGPGLTKREALLAGSELLLLSRNVPRGTPD